MPDPATYRPAPGSIPVEPGVYRFRDPHGRVIYVGKAKSLRSRLNSYFADLSGLAPRTRQMVMAAAGVEWTVVTTEVEALQLEYNWIKEFDPRFNIRYRDDKSYPVLAVTLNEEYPRLMVYRGPRRKGVRYFGPYSHAWAIRETLDLLTRVFPARTCSGGVFKRHSQIDRPCLLGYIDKCSAPCIGRVSAEEHRRIVLDFCDFLAGKTDRLVRDMEQQMNDAAAQLDFERAARLRDNISALRRALEKQTVVLGDGTDADVVAFADEELEAAVQVFHVRGGRVRGQRGWIVEKSGEPGESSPEYLVEQFLTQFYGDQAELVGAADEATNPVPRQVLVPVLPDTADELETWLSALRGSRVTLRVPQRGDKRALAETVKRNAQDALAQHKLKRAGDFTAMHLVHPQRVLAAVLTTEKIAVIRIQPDACGGFREPVSQRDRYPELRLEGPSVGADVDETRRHVLTRRHDHAQTRADHGRGRALRKLLRADSGIAHEVRREPQTQVAQSGTIDLPCRIENLAAHVRLCVRHDDPRARRTPGECEGAQISDGVEVDFRLDVGDRERRIGQHLAAQAAVVGDEEVRSDRPRGIRARLELLAQYGRGQEGSRYQSDRREPADIRSRRKAVFGPQDLNRVNARSQH